MARLARMLPITCALLLLSVAESAACSCRDAGPPCQAYWSAEVIFRGRADAIGRPADRNVDPHQMVTVTFTVLEPLKGVEGRTIQVRTPTGPASCALRFSKGREYVVHASRVNGAIVTNACSRTRRVERAAEDLEYARRIASGGAPLGRIGGRVRLRSRSLSTGRYETRPMPAVPVTLRRGDSFAVMVRTDSSGEFAASGLEAGTYSITVAPLGRFRIDGSAEVALADARGCTVTDIDLYPDGRVSGRVVDPGGNPVRGLTVDLMARTDSPSGQPVRRPERLQTVTGSEGRYEFVGVPPGRFVAGINLARTLPGPRVFHPGVTTLASATVIDVPAGGDAALPDLVIPPDIGFFQISGVIVDPNRVPVEGARVYLRGLEEPAIILTAPVLTGPGGRFTIAALAGQEYVLFAERASSSGRGHVDCTDLVHISDDSARTPLKLTLRSPR